jgi:hypothetical protein
VQVWADAVFEQKADDFQVTLGGGQMQWRSAVVIALRQIGLVFEEMS